MENIKVVIVGNIAFDINTFPQRENGEVATKSIGDYGVDFLTKDEKER